MLTRTFEGFQITQNTTCAGWTSRSFRLKFNHQLCCFCPQASGNSKLACCDLKRMCSTNNVKLCGLLVPSGREVEMDKTSRCRSISGVTFPEQPDFRILTAKLRVDRANMQATKQASQATSVGISAASGGTPRTAI